MNIGGKGLSPDRMAQEPVHTRSHSRHAQLQALRRIGGSFAFMSLEPTLAACEEMLVRPGVIDVSVVGRFKTGKSSFLNHLFGRDLLPVDVLPSTAVITRLEAGSHDCCAVRFLDGRTHLVPFAEAEGYITEKGNPGNCKQVSIVEMECQGVEKFDGLRFVDTPGTDSLFENNTKTALDWFPKMGAAILAVSISHPLSEQDLRLLGELRKSTPSFAILLTKADLVHPDKLKEVIDFVKARAARDGGSEPDVYPYSIRPGFERFREVFLRDFLNNVAGLGRLGQDAIIGHKLEMAAEDCLQHLRLALALEKAQDSARTKLLELLQAENKAKSSIRHELLTLAGDFRQRARAESERRFLGFFGGLSSALETRFNSQFDSERGGLRHLTDWYAKWLAAELKDELAPLSSRSAEQFEPLLEDAQSSVSRMAHAFQGRLADAIENALDMHFAGAAFSPEIKMPKRPDIQVSRIFDIPFHLLGFLVPMWLFRPLVKRHFRNRIGWEAQKNLYRLAGQWADAIGESIARMADDAAAFMKGELEMLTRLAEGKGESRIKEIEDAMKELEALFEIDTVASRRAATRPASAGPRA